MLWLISNVLQLHGAYVSGGDVNVILELMNWGSLAQRVRKQGPLGEDQLASVALQILRALDFIHGKHHIHGDVKPDNILVNVNNEAKLADFGLAAKIEVGEMYAESESGTMMYMAPEQHMRKRKGFASDIWAFGLTMMYLATGKAPYDTADYWNLLEKGKNSGTRPSKLEGSQRLIRRFQEFCRYLLEEEAGGSSDSQRAAGTPFPEETRTIQSRERHAGCSRTECEVC